MGERLPFDDAEDIFGVKFSKKHKEKRDTEEGSNVMDVSMKKLERTVKHEEERLTEEKVQEEMDAQEKPWEAPGYEMSDDEKEDEDADRFSPMKRSATAVRDAQERRKQKKDRFMGVS